ncbi:MAG: hypothetical protein LUF90_00340 [Rikenellaceae bacterium]|nr:hypothetical protein [Rikenellaceae bacterium]
MSIIEFPTDRIIDSTENNEFAEGTNDENLWKEDIVDTQISSDDRIPDVTNETGIEDTPVYNENGYKHVNHDR